MSANKKINLKELDINNIGGWPRQAQMGFCVIVAVIIILLGWWLFVRGKQTDDPNRLYIYRGIAARQFQRSFVLAEGIEVAGATLDNGLLAIDLERPKVEPKVRKVPIAKTTAGNAGSRVTVDSKS